ncbi:MULTISPECIES: response regulator transcription factor [unclassified Duganella]|uniref:response regulator n=1 Tax=unclassified Duganella TaxID=2636909 RepID=UPI0008866F28|nr:MULTISPECIES: response regulator transcription factor [unclassified Duganella]SDH27910.1 two component transcriptional regulator, LuxR family [Duganella sp. OV458]SDK39809.1 two component transcriptional regulator, LuxR family [Duganella sp. OV510]
MIRVLLCDDHRVVREGLKQILADAGDIEVAAECADGPEALRQAGIQAIDMVLLDIALPLQDGLEVLEELKRRTPRLPVLMLSTYPEKQYALRCYKLGAAGYLNKSVDADELLAAIRLIASGGSLAPGSAPKLPHEALSQREYQVFEAIAAGRSVGQIALELGVSSNTVSTYRARILEKTGTSNDVGIALYAVQHQLIKV